jgi:hypothetical protein
MVFRIDLTSSAPTTASRTQFSTRRPSAAAFIALIRTQQLTRSWQRQRHVSSQSARLGGICLIQRGKTMHSMVRRARANLWERCGVERGSVTCRAKSSVCQLFTRMLNSIATSFTPVRCALSRSYWLEPSNCLLGFTGQVTTDELHPFQRDHDRNRTSQPAWILLRRGGRWKIDLRISTIAYSTRLGVEVEGDSRS